MPNESAGSSLISTITRLIDNNINEGAPLDNLVTVLSLLCLICVFTRQKGAPSEATSAAGASANPVGKLIGDLMKGEGKGAGGIGGADTLMSLLPLLNNPQLKSKLNPSTIASVLGMLNSMGGKQSTPQDTPEQKVKESSPEEKQPPPEDGVALTNDTEEHENKTLGRYLNWKTNF